MLKGILKLSKTTKGKIIVALDRMNGKQPMPLSSVSLNDMNDNNKECEYGFERGLVTFIKVEGRQIFLAQEKSGEKNYGHRHEPFENRVVSQIKDSFLLSAPPRPKDLQEIRVDIIDNFNLKYYKYARFIEDKSKFFFYKNDIRRTRDGSESGHKFLIRPFFDPINFGQLTSRLSAQAACFHFKKPLSFTTAARMTIGIGNASIYETGITLHHIYGFPYIPASALKGLTRSWIIQNCFGTEQDSEATAFSRSKLLCDVFGCPEDISYGDEKPKKKKPSFYKIHEKEFDYAEKQGEVCFMDAFPTRKPELEADIMNVHYPDYYSDVDNNKNVAPTDYQSPIPINFLTVTKGSPFVTFFGAKRNPTLNEMDKDNFGLVTEGTELTGTSTLLNFVEYWLKSALTNHGVGAKTAVGYGFMQIDDVAQL